jgi:hypothetical protein
MNLRPCAAWLLLLAICIGCSGNPEAPPPTTPTGNPPKPPEAQSAVESTTSAMEPIPEMKDFLSQMDGNAEHIKAAAAKYAAPGVSTSDLNLFLPKDPKIVKTENEDDMIVYTMHVKAGVFVFPFKIYWKDGQIAELSMIRDEPPPEGDILNKGQDNP